MKFTLIRNDPVRYNRALREKLRISEIYCDNPPLKEAMIREGLDVG